MNNFSIAAKKYTVPCRGLLAAADRGAKDVLIFFAGKMKSPTYVTNPVTYVIKFITYVINSITYVMNPVTYVIKFITYVMKPVTYVINSITYVINFITYVSGFITYVGDFKKQVRRHTFYLFINHLKKLQLCYHL
jgi:hypothetical protein